MVSISRLLVFLLCLLTAGLLISGTIDHASVSGHPLKPTSFSQGTQAKVVLNAARQDYPPYVPVYRIHLRVHLGKSGRYPAEFKEILDEINHIWWSQAGICFEVQTLYDDRVLDNGMDIWFSPRLNESDTWNGYYRGDHDIWVRDTPLLGPAENPAKYPAARTAAHEFGHGFNLPHRQDSDDNLMRSKTFGWQLSEGEIALARITAAQRALPDTNPLRCGPPEFDTALSSEVGAQHRR
jgi:hypothetical protein